MVPCGESVRVSIGEPRQERCVPEYNALEKLSSLLQRFGKVTRQSRIALALNTSRIMRPLSLRTIRAQLLEKVLQTDNRDERKKIFAEAHAKDEIAMQYLNQGEIRVHLPGVGEQMAK